MPNVFWTTVASVAILVLFAILAAVKWRELAYLRRWSVTEGVIVSAQARFQANAPSDSNYDSSDSELLNVPQITFEYRVGQETYRGSRISMAVADQRYLSAKETIAKYPVGKTVRVYFDPVDPRNAALERNFSKADYVKFAWLLAIGVSTPWVLGIFFCQVYRRIEPRVVDPGLASVATGLVAFGSFFVVLTAGVFLTVIHSWFWSATTGRITSSSVESFHVSSGDDTYRTAYKPRILYEYDVNGQTFRGDRISFNFVLGGMSEAKAKRLAGRYRKRDQVTVYFNPRKPAESVLIRKASGLLLFPILAALFLGVAWVIVR